MAVFEAVLNSSKQSVLNWKVSTEVNVRHYVVEWSSDGRNFGDRRNGKL